MSKSTIFNDVLMAPLVAVGASDKTPSSNHILGGIVWGFVAGYLIGVFKGQANPEGNILGM